MSFTPRELEDAMALLEAAKAKGELPRALQERAKALGGDTRSKVETILKTPALARFKADYERWSAKDKAKAPWEEVQERLLANEGYKLKRASAMNEGGVLFGIDSEGKFLVADGGLEPIMTGMNYADIREAVRFAKDDKGKKTSTGYEMFGYTGKFDKSPEMLAFEAFTGQPFVKSPSGREWRFSWLESGDNFHLPRNAGFNPVFGRVLVGHDYPVFSPSLLGTRRLLRV